MQYQSINLDQTELARIRNTGGVAAGGTGTEHTNVLNFDTPAQIEGVQFATQVSTLAGGTSIVMQRPGLYAVTLGWSQANASDVVWAISLGAPTASLTVEPSFAVDGMRMILPLVEAAGAGAAQLSGTASILLALDAGKVSRSADRNIRFHAWDADAGGRPVDMLAEADVWYQIEFVQPLHF